MTACQDVTESLSIPKSLTPVFQDDAAQQVIDEVTITSYVKTLYKMNLAWLCHHFNVCRKGQALFEPTHLRTRADYWLE